MRKIISIAMVFLALQTSSELSAQNFQAAYEHAKQYFEAQQYQEAMKLFSSLAVYDQRNAYVQYALFYHALSAKRAGLKNIAKDDFYRLWNLYPHWEHHNEVKLHIAAMAFDEGNLSDAFKAMESIDDPKLSPMLVDMKNQALSGTQDIKKLWLLLEEFPKETLVATELIRKMGNTSEELRKKKQLMDKYKLSDNNVKKQNTSLLPNTKKTVNIAILFPFLLKTLTPTPEEKKNQQVLDLYAGMRMAVDSLNKWGTPVALYAYDTERDSLKIARILQYDEMKEMDLMIGPIFKEGAWTIKKFSSQYQIPLVVNPLSNDSQQLRDSEFSFLYQPAMETMMERLAAFLAIQSRVKYCGVYYDEIPRDSVKAHIFMEQAQRLDITPVLKRRLNVKNSALIQSDLTDKIDSVRYVIGADSLAGMYIASDNPLFYMKAINAIEARSDHMWLIGEETWVSSNSEYIRRFSANRVAFSAPNLIAIASPRYGQFQKRYVTSIGKIPSFTASTGFECVIALGGLLHKHGRYFQTGVPEIEHIPGYLNPRGYTYQKATRDNGEVPFCRFTPGGDFLEIKGAH